MGSSSSGRARSDPTHQHHSHLHVHSHSAHQGTSHQGNPQYAMECESPQSQGQGKPSSGIQGQGQPQHPGGGAGGGGGGGQGHPTLYSQQSWPAAGPTDQSGVPGQVIHGSHSQTHRHHSHHHRHQSPPSLHSAPVPGTLSGSSVSSASSHAGSGSIILGTGGGGFNEVRPGFPGVGQPQSGRTVDILPAGHISGTHSINSNSGDPPQIGSVNMQLAGYPAQYGQYPQPTWPGGSFPFNLATTVASSSLPGHEVTQQHTRTASERGEESPMVGVVVQQSPVASH